jgi:hypothetical protein
MKRHNLALTLLLMLALCTSRFFLTQAHAAFSITLPNGDINHDNFVEDQDYSILGAAWYSAASDANYDIRADLNGDAYVEDQDYSILGKNWYKQGATLPTGTAVASNYTWNYYLTGTVNLGDWAKSPQQVMVEAVQVGDTTGNYYTMTVTTGGTFNMWVPNSGTYNIVAGFPQGSPDPCHWLWGSASAVYTTTAVNSFFLYGDPGDIFDDNIVDATDWLGPPPPWLDIDGDGYVTDKDYSIMGLFWMDSGVPDLSGTAVAAGGSYTLTGVVPFNGGFTSAPVTIEAQLAGNTTQYYSVSTTAYIRTPDVRYTWYSHLTIPVSINVPYPGFYTIRAKAYANLAVVTSTGQIKALPAQ